MAGSSSSSSKGKYLYLLINFVWRMGVIYIADLIDTHSDTLKFTDTDYSVFSDAATHVYNGGSPFERKTYRYTPLAAYVCLVNPLVHPLACKVVFCLFDIFLAYLLWDIVDLQLQRSDRKDQSTSKVATFVSTLILSPFFFIMSCRGSNDQIIQALIYVSIYLVLKRWYNLGGMFFGLAIHFKIYPIIFSFVFFFFIDCDRELIAKGGSPYYAIVSKNGFFTWNRICFTFWTVLVFFGLTAAFYPIYGYEYLYEAYLYHFVRKDHRHNNSVYWFLIYQLFDEPSSTTIGILTFIPQWSLVIASGIAFYYDLFTAFFLQTWFFVMFNKVMTAQYYMWFQAFLPVILINSDLLTGYRPFLLALYAIIWVVGQCVWGFYANSFETLGKPTLPEIHLANCAFFLINMTGALLFLNYQRLHLQAEFTTSADTSPKKAAGVEVAPKAAEDDKVKGD